MAEIPRNILTDAGFTEGEVDMIIQGLVQGIDLHEDGAGAGAVNIDELSPVKKEALERFNMAVAADA